MTNVLVEQFQAPDTRRGARMLELVGNRAAEQLAGRRTWVIDAGSGDLATAARPRLHAADDDALALRRISSRAGESLPTLVGIHVRTGDVVVIRDRAAIGVSRLVRERGAHVIWDGGVTTRGFGSLIDVAPAAGEGTAIDAWLAAWSSVRRRPRRLAAFIGAPGILSEKQIGAGASGDRYERLGWTSLLAEIVRQDRADRVGGTVAARPFVAPR